ENRRHNGSGYFFVMLSAVDGFCVELHENCDCGLLTELPDLRQNTNLQQVFVFRKPYDAQNHLYFRIKRNKIGQLIYFAQWIKYIIFRLATPAEKSWRRCPKTVLNCSSSGLTRLT